MFLCTFFGLILVETYYFYSRSIFTEEKGILSKLNYFKRKEETKKNHFVRSYEIEKEDWSV